MGKRGKILILVILVVFIAGLASYFLLSRNKLSEAKNVEGLKKVRVTRRDLRKTVVSSGTVKPQVGAKVKVGSRVSGKVEKLFVQVGDIVKKGQVVAIIEHDDLDARLRQAEARVVAAKTRLNNILVTVPKEISKEEARIREIKAELALAKLEYNRRRSLLSKQFVAREDVDRALKQVKVLKAQLASARQQLLYLKSKFEEDQKLAKAQIKEAVAALEIAKINRSYATIRAPMSGIVASVSTQEGETVAASLNAPTFITLIDLKRLQVNDYVDETDIGSVRVGQEAIFTVDTFPDRIFHGKVNAIHPMATIQESVVYYDAVIEILDDYEELLRPEMTTNVTIIVDVIKDALAIPSEAIVRIGQREMVAVRTGEGIEKREVVTGVIDGDYVEIKKGLKEGEVVVIGALKSKARGKM